MPRISHEHAECPVARAVDVVGDRWSLLILRDVYDGTTRFGALQRSLGLATNVLATRLRVLTDRGILTAVPASDGSAYLEYTTTEVGDDLFAVVVALRQWGEEHLFGPDEQHSVLVDAARREPLGRLQVADDRGRPVGPAQTVVLGAADAR